MTPAEIANSRYELSEMRGGLARTLAAAERLGQQPYISKGARDALNMMARDIAIAGKRHAWLVAAVDRHDDRPGRRAAP